jgi:hypothetical protein
MGEGGLFLLTVAVILACCSLGLVCFATRLTDRVTFTYSAALSSFQLPP